MSTLAGSYTTAVRPADVLAGPLLAIVGPTASGKSIAAIHLARLYNGEIVNADSRQFYREMTIGTAKPETSELAAVPHHLIDCASITAPWSVADFVTAAASAIADIRSRARLPILVGGTGMYLRALVEGLDAIPPIGPEILSELKTRFSREGLPALYTDLRDCDPESATRIGPRNTHRILRALAVFRQTGRPIHSFWRRGDVPRAAVLKIALQPEAPDLKARIAVRVDAMLKRGLREEARDLFQRYPENLLLKKTIGYAEWGRLGFEEVPAVAAAIKTNSRRLAKRQMTWFRHERGIVFLPPVVEKIAAVMSEYLRSAQQSPKQGKTSK